MKRALTILLVLACGICNARTVIEPDATYLFAQKDGQDLYLDVYEPARGSATQLDGKDKPTILYVFGGGFKEGERDNALQQRWFKMLTEQGYRVIANDYRLGLRDVKDAGVSPQFIKDMENAVSMAVEDLFSATRFIIDNAGELGIDPSNLVVSGSSAGAITALQAEWVICNRGELARMLPADFNYKGVISFSGAVFSSEGAITYDREPCPMMLLHGTADSMVTYKQIWFFKYRFAGTDIISSVCQKKGYCHNTYRFLDNGHEISISMKRNFPEEMRFIEENVIRGVRRSLDCTVSDPGIPVPAWARNDYKSLYK